MMHRVLLVATLVCLAGPAAMAQDPTKVAPDHYKVMFENAQVRVLKVQYGPHEKSAMHSHPNSVVIFISDADNKFTMPDGKTEERKGKAGETMWSPAVTHSAENLSDKPLEGILVELKSKPMAKKPAVKPAM